MFILCEKAVYWRWVVVLAFSSLFFILVQSNHNLDVKRILFRLMCRKYHWTFILIFIENQVHSGQRQRLCRYYHIQTSLQIIVYTLRTPMAITLTTCYLHAICDIREKMCIHFHQLVLKISAKDHIGNVYL